MSRFLERLATAPLVADGGMGALIASAVPRLRCPEEANLRAGESVVDVHLGYIRAGADLIETNSFGANRPKLAQRFLEEEFEAVNVAAVRLAREAREIAGRDVFIAGSIGPLGDVELSGHDPAELFAEHARLLEGRGVDLFMVETFYDLHELETAVAAVRSVSSLPIVALMSFDAAGETLAGVSAERAAERLRALEVAAFGANHGAGPTAALRALARMGGDEHASRRAAERRTREHVRAARRLPPRHARVLRRVRGAGARARRTVDRRLLRNDPGPDRRDPGGRRRGSGPRRTAARPGARPGSRPSQRARRRPVWRARCERASSRSRCRSTRRSARIRRR